MFVSFSLKNSKNLINESIVSLFLSLSLSDRFLRKDGSKRMKEEETMVGPRGELVKSIYRGS